MNYSNQKFEEFQQRLEFCRKDAELLWEVRDALFMCAFYGHKKRQDIIHLIPGGWLLLFGYNYLRDRKKARGHDEGLFPKARRHFLILSRRNNHTGRMNFLLRKERQSSNWIAWCTEPQLADGVKSIDQERLHSIECVWCRHFTVRHIFDAVKLVGLLKRVFSDEINSAQWGSIRAYLIRFFAWRDFWENRITKETESVITTYEKSEVAKAMFYVAKEKKVSQRIHWIHGLRHASLQSTLSTELWCMTPGDVRFFKKRVPNFCTPRVKKNPEALELAETIGVLDPTTIDNQMPINFLFLGPGLETSYTKEMRMADLAVIRKIQLELGSDISFRFRPHPSAVERFRSELDEASIEIEDFSSRHLHDDLRWAHAVGSSWSSLLLDIQETGRVIFWVQAEIRSLGAVDELIADGIGIHIGSDVDTQIISVPFKRSLRGHVTA